MKTQNKDNVYAKILVPVTLVLFAVAAIYISTTFAKMPPILKRGIHPSDFPQLIAGLIIALSLMMAIFDPVKVSERVTRQTLYTFMVMAIFVILVQVDLFIALGFFAATLAFLWGEKQLKNLFFVGFFVPVSIFFLFDLVFKVRFPRGILTNLWYG
jgi:hypothetical protein